VSSASVSRAFVRKSFILNTQLHVGCRRVINNLNRTCGPRVFLLQNIKKLTQLWIIPALAEIGFDKVIVKIKKKVK